MTALLPSPKTPPAAVYLSIVVPAYNEADRIVPTLEKSIRYLARQSYSSEVIVVSDGSSDKTGRVVEQFQAPAAVRLRFLEYHPNRGKGYAVRYGMLRAAGAVRMFMDADYAVEIAEADKGLRLLARGWDIAIASRTLPGSRITSQQNAMRKWSAKVYTFIQNRWLNLRFQDTQCGFKLFRAAAARDLFSRQKRDSVIFDPEILWLALRRGYRVGEFPVVWTHVGNSRIQYDSLKKSLFVFQELFRIKNGHRRCG